MKDAVGKLLPLLLGEDSPAFAPSRRHKKLAREVDTALDCLLFRRTFEAQHWLNHAELKLKKCGIPADAKTLRRCIKRVRERERLLLGILIARRSSRASRENL